MLCFCPGATRSFGRTPARRSILVSVRCRGAKERRERRSRAEARIRLQLCRDAVRITSHRDRDGCRRAHTDASTQTTPVDELPVMKHVTPAAAVPNVSLVLVIEYVLPASVIECNAPAPAVTYVELSLQLLLVYTTTTVTTDDNLDMTGLVYPQCSSIEEGLFRALCR